ncbi:MAG: helix-turn-helix domain-containing protein [Janthinobacterium lividum]
METLKYTVIKTESQYQSYCGRLEMLVAEPNPSTATQEETDLLTLLIETWDHAHATLPEADPIELLRSLMAGRQLLAKDLADVLSIGKGAVSDILNRRRGLSKEVIRRLASYFKVSQETFNRPYELAVAATPLPRNARVVHQGQAKVAA